MTTVAVLCDPPREGVVLSGLAAATPLSETETADLYAAMCADVFRAAAASAGELLVNHRPEDALPETDHDDRERTDPETELRAVVEEALADPTVARYEEQVGTSFSGRVGNTVTHLLETEDETSVLVVEPTAPFLGRGDIDGLAMKLRRSDVVVGPTSGGRVHAAGFSSPIDFADAYAPPAVETLTDRALDAGLGVDYAPVLPVVETSDDLAGALALIDARRRAGRVVPERTAAWLADSGLALAEENGELALRRSDTDRP